MTSSLAHHVAGNARVRALRAWRDHPAYYAVDVATIGLQVMSQDKQHPVFVCAVWWHNEIKQLIATRHKVML